MRKDLEMMTYDQLLAWEQYLYDQEMNGEDTWFERDQVLWEINRRDNDKE